MFKKKLLNKAIMATVLLSLNMMGSAYADTTGTSVSAGQKINFGNYWQSKATGWTDGTKTQQSSYNKDAVTWRVLANNSGVLTLLSDKALYADAFDSSSAKWSTSAINTTLNNTTAGSGFMGDAFTSVEQGLIVEKTYNVSDDIGAVGTYGESNVRSKLYLLDYNDVKNGGTYGFSDESRKALATDFAQNVNVYGNNATAMAPGGNAIWWLRSPGASGTNVGVVMFPGNISVTGFNLPNMAVRPALDLNLQSLIYTSAAEGGKSSATAGSTVKFGAIGTDSVVDVTLKDTSNTYTTAITASTLALDGSNVKMTLAGGTMTDDNYFASAKFDASESGSVVDTAYLIIKKGGGSALSGEQTMNIGGSLISGNEYSLQLANEYHLGDGSIYYATTTDVKGAFSVNSGNVNYKVSNGESWTSISVGGTNTLEVEQTCSIGTVNFASGSTLKVDNDTTLLTIDNYSGNAKVFYAHDATAPTTINGGDITIKSAATGSAITLITDNSGITMTDDVAVDGVLNALANKLYYTGYVTGEENLGGVVQIAEGLTSASATLVTSEMMFKATTGQGMLKGVSLGTQITNDKTTNQEYVDLNILRDDDKYHFDKDFLVDVKNLTGGANLAAAAYGANPLDLELADNTTLTLGASGSGKLFTIDAKNGLLVNGGANSKLVLDLLSSANAYGGINMTADDNTKVATINTDVEITSKSSGTGFSGYAVGMYVNNGTMNINGKLTMKDGNKPGVVNISGAEPEYFGWIDVYSTNGAVVNLKEVDIISGGEGLYANNGGSVLNVEGGSIVHLKNNSRYYALRAAGATINMNMNGDKTAPANNKVVIKGNITTQSDWVNKNSDNTKDTVINLGLTTSASSLTGVAYNVFGNDGIVNSEKTFRGGINMWLQNGATWNNENWSTGEAMKGTYGGENFAGSHVANLTGGSSVAASGIIFQKDSNPLTIDNYSGNTKVFYAHNNDGDEASDYAAGDITIKKAAADSAITLITDNTGISDVTKADATLNALAGKLIYSAYVTGEKNLIGKVEIAEGLTASSASMRLEQIDFDAENGKGKYEVPATKATQVITGDITVDTAYTDVYADGVYTIPVSAEIAGIDAKQDMIVVSAGTSKKKAAKITKQVASGDAIGVANKGNAEIRHAKAWGTDKFAAVVDVKSDAGNAYGIYSDGTSNDKQAKLNYNYHDEDFDYDAKGSGAYFITAEGSDKSFGVYSAGNSKIELYQVNIGSDGAYTLKENDNGLINSTGLYAGKGSVLAKGGEIVVDGNVDIFVNGNGAFVNGGNAQISTYGGGEIAVNKDNTHGYVALGASGGKINLYNINTHSAMGYKGGIYNIKGNLMVSTLVADGTDAGTETEINLDLVTGLESSTAHEWTGVAYNAFADNGLKVGEKTYTGAINLWLDKNSTWNNELWGMTANADANDLAFSGSHIANLTGGNSSSEPGNIFQKDTNPLTVDKLTGAVKIYYAHEEATPTKFNAGDTIIRSANESAVVIMATDHTGITTSDDAAVNAVLNALANKLYYTGYVTGERNLSGAVQILESLTSSSATLKMGDIVFAEASGQGALDGYTPEPPPPTGKQTVFDYTVGIANTKMDDKPYVDGGVRQSDGTYKMEGNTTIALKDVSVANTAIMNSNSSDLTINAGNNELKTSIDGTKQIYGILQNDNNQIDITASKFVVDVTSTGRTEAISVTNTDANKKAVVTINADTYLTANAGSGAAMGIHATGNSEVNINGNLTMKGDGTEAKPWGVSLTSGGYSYFGGAALYSHNSYGTLQKSGDINVSGMVDIEAAVNGAYVNGGGGTINMAGGSIKINKDNTAGYAALRAESGYINMNMKSDGSAGINKVKILGNVDATAGAYNLTLEPCLDSIVNLAMTTNDSTWTGVAYNAFPDEGLGGTAGSGTWKGQERNFTGAINLWLENGAIWNNEHYGITENAYYGKNFEGSHLAKLTGGNSAANAGIIFQNDVNPLTIDNYSGNTKVFYAHNNDGDEATDYAAGDITIKAAATGSTITLITDKTGISDVTKADATLAALAGKLIYSAYVTGEKNLSGKVEIAEGLTASSASLRLEDIAFNETTGGGGYKGIVVDPTDPTTPGGDDPEPVEPTVYNGLIVREGQNLTIDRDIVTTSYSDSYSAAGIAMWIGGSGVGAETHLTINGKVTMGTDDEHPGVVAEDKHGAYDFYAGTRWTGAGINMNQGHGSTITITKGLEIYADGHGIVTDPYYCDKKYADKDLAMVTVNGPTTIHVGSDEDVGLYALANYGGTININMKNGAPGKDKVDIFGNAIVMKDTMGESKNPYFYRSGEINLALTTADSLWTGAVDNTGTTQVGDFNLYLQNGGTWDYQPASRMDGLSASTMPTPSNGYYGSYDGVSHITNLTGGSDDASRGVIRVNYDDTLAIANYSGNVLVAYEHDEVSPTTIYGGDIKIANAKVGSVITLFTDNKGVNSGNYTTVLDALAGKLYYTADNENLIGQVQIGEGLTSQSMTYKGYIAYGANGQGKYTKEKGTTVVDTPIGEGTDEGAFKVEVTQDGTKIIKMDENAKMVSVDNGPALQSLDGKPLVVDNPQATLVLQSKDAGKPVVAADKGDVKIKGAVEVIGVPGQKLMDVAEGKKMDLAGGEFTAVPDPAHPEKAPVALELAKNAVVSIGMPAAPAQPGAPAPKPLPVKLTGDIQNTEGTLNLNLGTPDSFWKGNYQNEDAVLNLTIDNKDAKWEGKVNGATLKVDINAGTWVNTGESKSKTNNFTLNAGGVKKAFIDMTQESGDITIDKYSGGMTLIYSNDETTPTNINGGDVTIKSAEEKSVVNLWTDGKGLDLTTEVGYNVANDDKVKEVLNELAKKLIYEGYKTEGHITGEVGVGEALTRPAVTFPKAAALVFADGENGKGSIDASTFKDNIPHGEVVYGDSETAMMRGAKMAMASTAMIWRAEANDLTKRMGDLQLRKEEAGVWAKYYSGRQEYNNNGSFSNKYKAVQFGVDKTLGHGWLGGIALSYDDGSGSLNNGGRADNKVQSLGFYGTKVNKNGEYIDLIGKFSRLENEYTVYNDYGYSLDGDYKNFGMSVSAEYGKHINLKNGLVLTPAVEFTLGRVNSKNYDAYSEYYEKSMTVKQDAFNSAIGRIGISLGKETGAYSYYAKLGLAHEFAGGFDTTYSAPGEPTSGTSVDFKDTWKEVQVGGSVKLKNDALLYGSFSKSFGGDVKEKWRVDAGLMFTFNHLSDFFSGKKVLTNIAVPVGEGGPLAVEGVQESVNIASGQATVIAGTQVENESVTVGDSVAVAEVKPVKSSGNTYVMDECIVTASKTKQRITDATADVSVVTRAEIEAMHMNSVEEVLRTVPGVEFNNYGSGNQMNANISSLRINGSKDVALLVDGVKINDFQGVGEAGNMYAGVLNNMNNIERVEVLRGAAGVLYGSGAKGGVINIITREINENQTIADVSVGSFGRKDTKFSTMGKAGKLTYNFSQGTYKQGDVTDGRGEKWEGHTKTNNFGGKVTYNFTDNNKLTLDYMDIHSNFGGTDLIYSNFYSGKYDSTMWSIRDDWQIDKNWSNTFVYRQNEEKRQHQQQYFAGNVLKNSDTDFKYTFISDQITFHNDRHNLVMGVDYSQGKDQQTTLVNGVGVKREMKNTSFYINEDWTIVPHVTLSGGLRHDRPNEDKYGSKIDSHTTKSYKLAWDVTKKDTVYAGRSEYFILPSMSQLYDKEWGNEGLKPAEGRTESIGYNKKFNDNNFLTVNYFQTKEECGIGWDGYNRVNTSGVSRGWNAQFSSRLSDKWNFNVGWSHLFEHSDGNDNYTLGYYPRDLATFGVYYNVGKFDAGLDGYWFFRKMDYSGRREFPADNYGIYNLSMNYKPTKNMKLYCKVENIFNKYYAEHTDAGSDPYLTGDGDRKYYAMPGRAFMVGLEFKF